MHHTPESADYWIDLLKLNPHPEGGFYREVYRSGLAVQTTANGPVKQACTSIYYLLQSGDFSAFHRLQSDEIWYFHKGAPLTIYIIHSLGELQPVQLSDQPDGNLSICVKANQWFAALPAQSEGFTLVSCAVAPGFEFAEFEMAARAQLAAQYPQHSNIINQLCRM